MVNDSQRLPDTSISNRISWSSIFAGSVITLVVQFMLVILGMAIGLASIKPGTEDNPTGDISIGAATWWIFTGCIAFFTGSCVASRLARLQRASIGILQGLVTWGLATLLTIYLMTTTLGVVLGGAFTLVQNAASGATEAASATVATDATSSDDVLTGRLMRDIQQVLAQRGKPGVAQNSQIFNELKASVQKWTQGNLSSTNRKDLSKILQQHTTMTPDEANQMVDNLAKIYQQTQQKTEKTSRDIARALSIAAWASFAMLLLTGIAAAIGGAKGAIKT